MIQFYHENDFLSLDNSSFDNSLNEINDRLALVPFNFGICSLTESEAKPIKEQVILNFKISHNDLSNSKFFYGINQIFSNLISKKDNDLIENYHGKEICILKNLEINNLAGIVFEIDSFGGSAIDSLCLSEKINYFKEKFEIPVVSHIKTGYSAGYMLPSLCSDKIFISKYGDVGSVGVYFKEYNFSKILNAINLDAIVFASEGTVSQKYHDSSLPITEDLRLSRIKDATRVFEMYLNELEEKRSFIFKRDNDSDSHKEEFLDEFFLQEDNKFKDDYNDWENSVNFFKSGYNFSSIDAKKLGLVDEIGQKEDALNYIKDLVNLNKEFDYKFKIIDINFDDFKNLGNLVNYSDFNQSFSSSSLSDSSSSDSFSFDEGFNSGKDYNGIFSLVKSDEFLIKSAIQAYIKKYI